MILWQEIDDQPLWGAAVERLKVGRARPFSAATLDSLVADLCSILTPECAARACKVAALMTPAAESVARAADLLEDGARPSPKGDVMRTPPPRLDRS